MAPHWNSNRSISERYINKIKTINSSEYVKLNFRWGLFSTKSSKNEFLTHFFPILDFIFWLVLLECQHQFELNAQICATNRLLHSLVLMLMIALVEMVECCESLTTRFQIWHDNLDLHILCLMNFESVANSGWPDWVIYRHLGNFLEYVATNIFAQIFGNFLGNFKTAQFFQFLCYNKYFLDKIAQVLAKNLARFEFFFNFYVTRKFLKITLRSFCS